MANHNNYHAKDAMKLHASTQAAAKAHASGGWTPLQKIGYAIWAVVGFAVLSAMFAGKRAPDPAPQSTATTAQLTKPELFKTTAALININGDLCAQVESMTPLGGNKYTVKCVRYRDGSGSATYELDATTGLVK